MGEHQASGVMILTLLSAKMGSAQVALGAYATGVKFS